MRRAKIILIPVLLLLGGWLVVLAVRTSTAELPKNIGNGAGGTNAIPSLAARNQMSQQERLKWLERSGEVPDDAVNGNIDWQLAQRTSWWGKPLDPKVFWKNRVVWLDKDAEMTARRHGRDYPPLPFEDLQFNSHSTNDFASASGGIEGPNIAYYDNDRESAFWDYFQKTHPKPPEEIKRAQEAVVVDYFSNLSPKLKETLRNRPVKMNYPQEAFTADALYWAYIRKNRAFYEKYTLLPRELAVDSKLITEPLTADQLKAANVWKLAYLQRLRREKTDEQYIQAYLKAWNLTENEVFGAN